MVVFIVIGGESQCEIFAQICLIADYLSQQLPNFCYERIEKSILDWPGWLCKMNLKNNWHHLSSPIVWKELLMKGSKPYYIGGASDFLEYCHSYYNFDVFMGPEKYESLIRNYNQFKKKMKKEDIDTQESKESTTGMETVHKNNFVICISGASCPLAKILLSRLLDLARGEKSISKIYLYDEDCSREFLEKIETECSFIGTNYPGKVVKYTDKIGNALTIADMLIVLDYVPFDNDLSIGEWLHANMRLMQSLAIMINASASRSMFIILANLGPACFNATVLMHSVTVNPKNIIVATSDLGLSVVTTLQNFTEVPVRKIFCPPVWGFVGVNHLVDIHTTVHQNNTFEPYNRHTKVNNSTLTIGCVVPEMRTMEYLTYFREDFWIEIAEQKNAALAISKEIPISKAVCILNLLRIWLLEPVSSDIIVPLGILCNGSFGLTFDGAFSQPAQLIGKEWRPASEFPMPKDRQMKLPYLQTIAELCMNMGKKDLPPIIPYTPCTCKTKYYKKKEVR